jgi:hypothetical protein
LGHVVRTGNRLSLLTPYLISASVCPFRNSRIFLANWRS